MFKPNDDLERFLIWLNTAQQASDYLGDALGLPWNFVRKEGKDKMMRAGES